MTRETRETTYYTIQLFLPGGAPSSLWLQQEKNELFLSANVRLCGPGKMACLESAELAKKFREACLPKIQKRYGSEVDVSISECVAWGQQTRTLARIKKDSELVKARLATGVLAPNQTP